MRIGQRTASEAIIMIIIPILVYLFSLQIIYNKLIYIFFIQQK